MKTLNIAVVGLGRVGRKLVEFISKENVKNRNTKVNIVGLCDNDPAKKMSLKGAEFTTTFEDIIQAENVDIVVECIGGVTASYEVISRAMDLGKHVVTCNRSVVSAQGQRLFRIAEGKGVHFRYEGAVMGAVPCVTSLFNGLGGQVPYRIYGVLNSASNYCLMRMDEKGESLAKAEKMAEELEVKNVGAEVDLNGKDSLQKMAVLRAAAYGEWTDLNSASVKSLTDVKTEDVRLAGKLGFRIKQLAMANSREVHVAPYLVDDSTLLGNTNGMMNGVVVETQESGDVFLAGNGAAIETVVGGVVNDIVAISRGARMNQIPNSKRLDVLNQPARKYFYVRIPKNERDTIKRDPRTQVLNEVMDEKTGQIGLIMSGDFTRVSLHQNLRVPDAFILDVLSE